MKIPGAVINSVLDVLTCYFFRIWDGNVFQKANRDAVVCGMIS
jgi:hypothetical protein